MEKKTDRKWAKKALLVTAVALTAVGAQARPHFRHHGHGVFFGGFVGGFAGSFFAHRYPVVPVYYTFPTYYTYPTCTTYYQRPVVVVEEQPVAVQPAAVQQQAPAPQQPVFLNESAKAQQAQQERPELREGETMIIQPDGTRIITKQKVELNQKVEKEYQREN